MQESRDLLKEIRDTVGDKTHVKAVLSYKDYTEFQKKNDQVQSQNQV